MKNGGKRGNDGGDQDDGRDDDVDEVEVAGYAVNEEATKDEVEGWGEADVDGDELDPEQVKEGRR